MLLYNEISIDYLVDRSTESNLSDSTISLSDRFAITSLILSFSFSLKALGLLFATLLS